MVMGLVTDPVVDLPSAEPADATERKAPGPRCSATEKAWPDPVRRYLADLIDQLVARDTD